MPDFTYENRALELSIFAALSNSAGFPVPELTASRAGSFQLTALHGFNIASFGTDLWFDRFVRLKHLERFQRLHLRRGLLLNSATSAAEMYLLFAIKWVRSQPRFS